MAACPTISIGADREQINFYLENVLNGYEEPADSCVVAAMRYATLGGGQRIRPILSLRIGRLIGACPDLTLAAAGAVELLHCASLIIDDLPCMDNSALRRSRASVHVQYGEPLAILAAFGLVALAARSVLEAGLATPERERALQFQLSLLRSLDCHGLIAGQALDLEVNPRRRDVGDARVNEMKTASLFSLAVKAGSLAPIHDENARAVLAGFGREFGLAFQLGDDLMDGEEDNPEPFQEKVSLLRALIAHFGAGARDLEPLIDYLDERVSSHKLR